MKARVKAVLSFDLGEYFEDPECPLPDHPDDWADIVAAEIRARKTCMLEKIEIERT